MGPQNGVIGDDSYGTTLPETQIDDRELNDVKSMASFANGKEWQRIKAIFEDRIQHYQNFLPDGRSINTLTKQEAMDNWPIANAIIGELKFVIATYENAKEVAKNVRR